MNRISVLKNFCIFAKEPLLPSVNTQIKRFRKPSSCDICLYTPDKKPCLDLKNISVERGNQCHGKLIRSFLYTHYWPREPSVAGLWTSLDCPYLEVLSDKYAFSGDRLLAFEFIQRTKEKKLVGVSVANKTFPWMVDELEDWAHFTHSKPERHRMYFIAHCIKKPNLFRKYNVDYLYDVEILGTAPEVAAQGVGVLLMRSILDHAEELRHPLVHVIAVSHYAAKICEKCGMNQEWSMQYSDFIDNAGQKVFFPRRPHHAVSVYTKHFNPAVGYREPCKPPYL